MTDNRREQNGEVPVSDRRRFTANGELREGSGVEEGALPDLAAAEPAPDMVPVDAAEEWERRAREAESRLAELADGYRRARLELEAVRARLERDQELRVQDAKGRVFQGVIAALDGLDRALEHAEDGPLAEGVRLVQRMLLDALNAEGVERLELIGRPFDPAVAEAVATSPAAAPAQANTVVAVVRAGYKLGDRVLRAAQVRVSV